MHNNEKMDNKIDFIYHAIQDTQETIRFLDTKSGVVIALTTAIITALLALINDFFQLYKCQAIHGKYILFVGLILFVLSVLITLYLGMKSVAPRNNPNEHIIIGDENVQFAPDYYLTGLTPKMRIVDYLAEKKDSTFSISVMEHYKAIMSSTTEQLLLVLSYELIKLSYIRDKKLKRTNCSITWLGISVFIASISTITFFIFR